MAGAGRTRLVAILALAGLARFWAIDFCLPALQCRPDEEAVASIATRFFARDLNPHFFDWPTLFMYVVAVGVVVFFKIGLWLHWFRGEYHFLQTISDFPAPVFLIARLFSATSGVVSVWLVYRIGLRLFSPRTAIVASAFLALAFLHVRDSHFGVTDVAATCLTLAAFLFVVRFDRSQSRRDMFIAALWAGLAMSTKYGAALIAAPALWTCLWPASTTGRGWLERVKRAIGFLVVMAAAFAATSPYCLIAFDQFIGALGGVSTHLATPHAVMLGRGWQVHLTSSLRYGLGLPLLLTGLVGLLMLSVKRPRDGILVALFPLVYYATVGSGYTAFARYAVPLVPFICLTAAYCLIELAHPVTASLRNPRLQLMMTGLLALLIIAPSAWSIVQFDRLLRRPDSRVRAAAWVRAHVPQGATIAETGGPWTHLFLLSNGQYSDSGYRQYVFKEGDRPDVLIVSSSRRAPDEPLPDGAGRLMQEYRPVCLVAAFDPADGTSVYDWQDEFYLPLSGFRGIVTGGPNLAIYARPDFAPAADDWSADATCSENARRTR